MTSPTISFREQLLRRRPVAGAPVAHGASDHLTIARVFIGSKGAKIVRHSPVPVLVLPN